MLDKQIIVINANIKILLLKLKSCHKFSNKIVWFVISFIYDNMEETGNMFGFTLQ